MYLGLDIGTSSVKAVLVDAGQRIVASRTTPLEVSRPHPGWSEQDADSWWVACQAVLDGLKTEHGKALAAVKGIGLSGHMHGGPRAERRQRAHHRQHRHARLHRAETRLGAAPRA